MKCIAAEKIQDGKANMIKITRTKGKNNAIWQRSRWNVKSVKHKMTCTVDCIL